MDLGSSGKVLVVHLQQHETEARKGGPRKLWDAEEGMLEGCCSGVILWIRN